MIEIQMETHRRLGIPHDKAVLESQIINRETLTKGAPHIHQWFLTNTKAISVHRHLATEEDIRELLSRCHMAQLHPESAEGLFPHSGNVPFVDESFYREIDKIAIFASEILRNFDFKRNSLVVAMY